MIAALVQIGDMKRGRETCDFIVLFCLFILLFTLSHLRLLGLTDRFSFLSSSESPQLLARCKELMLDVESLSEDHLQQELHSLSSKIIENQHKVTELQVNNFFFVFFLHPI